jgi:hypothetical protein
VWSAEFTNEFHDWWLQLDAAQQDAIESRVQLLQEQGPGLGRPVVDTISGSRHANMKELRADKGGSLRVLFAFDPRRSAILLIGGNKSPVDTSSPNWNGWYKKFIPIADDLYEQYLMEIQEEGLI